MAKFCGKIGFATTLETRPGIWEEEIVERLYYGDLIKNSRRLQNGSNLNSNVIVSNEISIVADAYANENFTSIRYVEIMGTKWIIENISVERPRLILSLGGIYNEN